MKILTIKFTRNAVLAFSSYIIVCLYSLSHAAELDKDTPQITVKQAKVLKMLNQQQANNHHVKNLRLPISKLSDSQGQVYLGALINRAQLLPYLTQLKDILKEDYQVFGVLRPFQRKVQCSSVGFGIQCL